MQYKRLGNFVAIALVSAVGWTLTNTFRPIQADAELAITEAISPSTSADEASVAQDFPENQPPAIQLPEAAEATVAEVTKVGEPASTQLEGSRSNASLSSSASAAPGQSLQGESSQATPADTHSSAAIAKVFPHEFKSRPAATIYVRDIPVFTVLGDAATAVAETPVDANSDKAAELRKIASKATDQTSPLWKANKLAAKFNLMRQSGGVEADKISVKWEDKQYLIQLDDETLVTLNDDIILPDTTGAPAEDALQATNRLRRLLGDKPAEPLSEVANLPEPPKPQAVQTIARASSYYQQGMASWYGPGFHGNMTANGEIFNQNALTAAHRYLSFGTWVRVTNLHNGYAVNVRINDRGPYSGGRVIDLSAAAADYIGLTNSGVAPVRIDILN